MRTLVTGHQGYLGAVLVPILLRDGFDLLGLDAGWFEDSRFESSDTTPFARIPNLRHDLREVEASDLSGIDAVVHLAALSNDPLGNLAPQLTTEINYGASLRFAELCKAAGVRRFVFFSSCSSYGAAGDDFLDEQAPFHPQTPYAVEKVRLETALAGLADDDFSPTFLRNATAYGLSPRLRLDLVLNNLVAWAHTTGKVLLLSDGTPWRPIVHAEDIAAAALAVLRAPRELVHNQAYNVGRTAHNYQIRELAEIVCRVVPGSLLVIAPGAGPDNRSYRVDFKKIETQLPGFLPTWDAERAAVSLVRAFKEFGLRKEHLEGPEFIRLNALRALMAAGRLDKSLRRVSTRTSSG